MSADNIRKIKQAAAERPKKNKLYLSKRSEKFSDEMKDYKIQVKKFLAKPENQDCQIKSKVCTRKATVVNHKKRRGARLMAEEYWQPACKRCNQYIEAHDAVGREIGALQSKFVKDKYDKR